MQSTYKYLYVRTQADVDNDDGADDSLYIPVKKITGILTTGTTAITIFFESVNNKAGNIADNEVVISDSVVLNVTAGKTKQVMQTIVRTINENRFSDGLIVLADDATTTLADATVPARYLDGGITSCGAITVASKLT